MTQRYYRRDREDKLHTINRCFFEAEHGWITLTLDRLADLLDEFPNDSQVEYAEGMIRRDFLGQGIAAEQLFLAAQQHATDRSHSNENYLFVTFNATKYARNEGEYRRQERIARKLAPSDPDLALFDSINASLAEGDAYGDIVGSAAAQYQEQAKHGECAAFAELALGTGELSRQNEIVMRKSRAGSLRELDKAAEASRLARGEAFPPEERLVLVEAVAEMDRALALDPYDHMCWNFRSAWLNLLGRYDDAIAAADKALALCPQGYLRPFTNKIHAYANSDRKAEARRLAVETIAKANTIGSAALQDRNLAQRMIEDIDAPKPSDDEILSALSERVLNSAVLTAKQVADQWQGGDSDREIAKGLHNRIHLAGTTWNLNFASLAAEFLQYFSPETVWKSLMLAGERDAEGYKNVVYAIYYVASHVAGVVQRDACRCILLLLLGSRDPDKMRADYREAVMGLSQGAGDFASLEGRVRAEMARSYPILLRLFPNSPPLSPAEIQKADHVTIRTPNPLPMANEPAPKANLGCLVLLVAIILGVLYLFFKFR